MKRYQARVRCELAHREQGFSLLELMIVAVVLLIVLAGAVQYIALAVQRSKVEQTKVDLSEEGREFVDSFARDIHQAGYPGCRMFNTAANCTAHFNDATMAVGLAYVSNNLIVFEGDVDGDGAVDSVRYQLVDSAGNAPPTGTCPCTIQRSQVPKVAGTAPLAQATNYSIQVDDVVNSGVPTPGNLYGNGLPISGTVLFGSGSTTNTAYYAAVSTFTDFPVFSAYDQNGNSVTLPRDITVAGDQAVLNCTAASVSCIKTVRLTLNLLGNGSSGYDPKTGVRPVLTLVGNGRINN
jgi:prepilin-type N-terminal cleavage/methylation domain-containing protein